MPNPRPDTSGLRDPVRDTESARALAALHPRGPRYGRDLTRKQVSLYTDQLARLPEKTNLSALLRTLLDAHLDQQ